jgi:hypothetical protein
MVRYRQARAHNRKYMSHLKDLVSERFAIDIQFFDGIVLAEMIPESR